MRFMSILNLFKQQIILGQVPWLAQMSANDSFISVMSWIIDAVVRFATTLFETLIQDCFQTKSQHKRQFSASYNRNNVPDSVGRTLWWLFRFIKKKTKKKLPSIPGGWHLRGIMRYSEIYTALTLTQPLSLNSPTSTPGRGSSISDYTPSCSMAPRRTPEPIGEGGETRGLSIWAEPEPWNLAGSLRGEEWQWIDTCD